jgi:hypothetical protein
METLLMVAVVLTALAIVVQAGVLVSMYLLSRRLTDKAELLVNESRRLIAPLESITSNLKTTADQFAETGKIAHAQILNIQEFVLQTQANIQGQLAEVRAKVLEAVDQARTVVMRPVRQYAAIATGFAEGVRTFFKGRKVEPAETEIVAEGEIIIQRERPAA